MAVGTERNKDDRMESRCKKARKRQVLGNWQAPPASWEHEDEGETCSAFDILN